MLETSCLRFSRIAMTHYLCDVGKNWQLSSALEVSSATEYKLYLKTNNALNNIVIYE